MILYNEFFNKQFESCDSVCILLPYERREEIDAFVNKVIRVKSREMVHQYDGRKDASNVPVTPVGQAPSVVVPTPGNGTGSLPTPDLNGAVANSSSPIAYEWSELKALAQANLSADELRDTYGIEIGDYKEVRGVKYILVDLDGNDYDGFVFMYNSGMKKAMNSTLINQGGYVSTDVMKPYVDGLYNGLATDLKSAIKKVTITCNSGDLAADGTDTNGTSTYTTDIYMFLASSKEVGLTLSGYQYAAEGSAFDYFSEGTSTVRVKFSTLASISDSWWLRSAEFSHDKTFHFVSANTGYGTNGAITTYVVVPTFVIG